MKQGNYQVEYCDDNVSPWGGFSVMQRFLERIKLREALGGLPLPESASNNSYKTHEIVESFFIECLDGML